MHKLILIYSVLAPAVISQCVLLALVIGFTTLAPYLAAAALGLAVSAPLTWYAGRALG